MDSLVHNNQDDNIDNELIYFNSITENSKQNSKIIEIDYFVPFSFGENVNFRAERLYRYSHFAMNSDNLLEIVFVNDQNISSQVLNYVLGIDEDTLKKKRNFSYSLSGSDFNFFPSDVEVIFHFHFSEVKACSVLRNFEMSANLAVQFSGDEDLKGFDSTDVFESVCGGKRPVKFSSNAEPLLLDDSAVRQKDKDLADQETETQDSLSNFDLEDFIASIDLEYLTDDELLYDLNNLLSLKKEYGEKVYENLEFLEIINRVKEKIFIYKKDNNSFGKK